MSYDSSIFSLLNLVESVDKITMSAVAQRVGRCEMSAWNRGIMVRIEGLLKHASSEFAKLMNDCRTINRIPPEILLLIFSFAGRGETVSRISHVCKWWRQLSVSSPALWTLYSTKRFPPLDIVLQRSRNALLDVRVHSWNYWTRKQFSPSRFHLDRLHTFDVVLPSDPSSYESHDLVETFPSAAMHLARLSLSTTKGYHYYHCLDVPFDSQGTHFASLFGGDMPRLKIFRLNGIPIWPQFSGPNLQFLVLTNSFVYIPSLLSALQNLSCLEVLVLASVILLGPPSPPECVVMMECFRVLHINVEIETDDRSIQVHNFLSSLALHAGTAVRLNVSSRSRDRESQIPPAAANHWTYSVNGMHTLCFGEEIIVSNDRSFVTYEPRRPSYNYIEVVPDKGIFFGCFYCRLAHVTHWILEPRTTPLIQYRGFDWPTFFGSMPLLKRLSVSSYSENELGQVCDILLEANPITHAPRYALRLADMIVTIRFHWGNKRSIEQFVKLLSTRCASGYPIKEVKLISHVDEVPDTYVELIKKYVHEVTVTLKLLPNKPSLADRQKSPIPRHFVEVEPDNIYSEYFDF